MLLESLVGFLSFSIASVSSAPTTSTTPTCASPQVLACCSGFNGTMGVGCIFSTLNVLNGCSAGQSVACCDAPQTGLVNVGCIPVNVNV